MNGGCCKYGQICGLLECYDDSPIVSATTITPTVSSDSITGSEGLSVAERTTVRNTNSTVTITSTSTLKRVTATIPLTTDSSTTSTRDIGFTATGGQTTQLDPNRPGATSVDSATGSRAKVGRHWSWAVITWWVIAIILEGV